MSSSVVLKGDQTQETYNILTRQVFCHSDGHTTCNLTPIHSLLVSFWGATSAEAQVFRIPTNPEIFRDPTC